MGTMRWKLALLLGAGLQIVARDSGAQTAEEIVGRIGAQSGVPARETTVDTFKAGNPGTRVIGIAVTMMATLEVLQRAVAEGCNLVITHEPTFYSHRDATETLSKESDAVYTAKQKYIAEQGLVIWRFHDRPHDMKPDMIRAGTVKKLGWETLAIDSGAKVFEIRRVTLGALADHVAGRLGAEAVRIVGDPQAVVQRVGLTQGFPGFTGQREVMQSAGLDALVMGEDHEWESIAYGADAVTAGMLKGLIVIGHVASEQAGVEEVARWIRTFVKEVPVRFVPARDPFRPRNRGGL